MGHVAWDPPNESEWTEWLMSSVDEITKAKEKASSLEARVLSNWQKSSVSFVKCRLPNWMLFGRTYCNQVCVGELL